MLQPVMASMGNVDGMDGGDTEMKKKPDLLMLLAVVIGMGVLVTELAYGMMSADNRPAQTQASNYRQ